MVQTILITFFMKTQHFSCLIALFLFFVSLSSITSALEVSNKFVKVTIETPADISNFTGIEIGGNFYFTGKAKWPTTEFNVTYEVVLTDSAINAKCVLVKPIAPIPPAPKLSIKTKGGLVTSYRVEYAVKGEKKVEGNIYFIPLEIKVNDTGKQEDDFVAVSKGTDEDLATDFSVKLTGTDGVTAELSIKPTDGDIKFKDKSLALKNGVETKTKLWGITPSSARDKTIIEITLKKAYKSGYKILGKLEEDVTVFEGVKLEFKGNFYINVDTREYARRPWDGRKDPKPNSKGDLTGLSHLVYQPSGGGSAFYKKYSSGDLVGELGRKVPPVITAAEKLWYKKAVDQSAGFGYESAISLKDGDNADIVKYKPWKDKLEVTISNVMSKTPPLIIAGDGLLDSLVEMKSGKLSGPKDFEEDLESPEFEVGNFFVLDQTTTTTKLKPSKAGLAPIPVSLKEVKDHVKKSKGSGYDELLNFYTIQGLDKYRYFSLTWGQWSNNTFELTKKPQFKYSIAAKGILGAKEKGAKIEVMMNFGGWNEFKSQGTLGGCFIETK
jgi:hypothetical protein